MVIFFKNTFEVLKKTKQVIVGSSFGLKFSFKYYMRTLKTRSILTKFHINFSESVPFAKDIDALQRKRTFKTELWNKIVNGLTLK